METDVADSTRERWSKALVSLTESAQRALRAGGLPIATPTLDKFLQSDDAQSLGQDPIFGTLMIFLDSALDAASHNFPDVGDELSVEDALVLVEILRRDLIAGEVPLPEKMRRFSRYLPFRP